MTDRLEEIFSLIPPTKTFADIGCDHGYISLAMLNSGKCEKAVLSDVSEKCLDKAIKTVESYIIDNKAKAVLSDGFDNLPPVDTALIAGMGGEEIISILKKASSLPETLVLQPMKNSDKVRAFLIKTGYRFIRDYTFMAEGKFYDLMLVKKGKDKLNEDEILFGRDNLKEKGEAFKQKIRFLVERNEEILKGKNLSEKSRDQIIKETEKLNKCLN